MNTPLVTVVMPVYNAGKYVHPAIESILNQSYSNLEIIVINDGSTDNSKNTILNFEDPRLRFFENPGNLGIVRTRNRGLDEAKGKYIAVMDSDDIALPDRIKIQVDFLENNPEYGMCASYFQTIDGNDKILKTAHFPTNDRDVRSNLLVHNCICHSTVMMRVELAKEIKYETEFDVIEDYLLWYKISRVTKIINLPVYTTYYRVHGNNISTTRNTHVFKLIDKMNIRILGDLNISYSEPEFKVHSNSLNYNIKFFTDNEQIKTLENWILKFLLEIEKPGIYNAEIVLKIFMKRYIVICSNTKSYKKLLFNKLLLRNPGIYLNVLFKKFRNKF